MTRGSANRRLLIELRLTLLVYFRTAPKEKLVVVLMVQAPQGLNGVIWRQTRTMVYQAMTQ